MSNAEPSGGDAPRIANTKQLLFAIGLGAVVVVLYNLQVNSIRKENQSDMESRLVWKVNKRAGETITREDVRELSVPRAALEGLQTALRPNAIRFDDDSQKLVRDCTAGTFVCFEDVNQTSQSASPSGGLSPDQQEVPIPVDPKLLLGGALRISDKVDLWALMPNDKGGYKATKVIGGVVVRTIGGIPVGTAQRSKRADAEGVLTYKQIGIQLRKDQVDKLYNLLTWSQTQVFWYTIRASNSREPDDDKVNEALKKYYETAAPTRHSAPPAPEATGQ